MPTIEVGENTLTYEIGDCRELMRALEPESVDMVVTSPPYWGLRDYGEGATTIWDADTNCEHEWGGNLGIKKQSPQTDHDKGTRGEEPNRAGASFEVSLGNFCSKCNAWKGQLGLEPHPNLYIKHIVEVCKEIKRVLKKSGSFYLNLGDTYFGQRGEQMDKSFGGDTWTKGPKVKQDCHWLQPKQLLLIPSRTAMALQNDEWCLRNDLIWAKPNPMPSSVKDRRNNTFEHIFHFIKDNTVKFYYNIKTKMSQDNIPKILKENIDWEWRLCPQCNKKGKIVEDIWGISEEGDDYLEHEGGEVCKRCRGTNKIKYSFWKGFRYYYDLDAVREPYHPSTVKRGKSIRQVSNDGDIVYHGGNQGNEFVAVDIERGKNPGDIIICTTKPYPEAHFATFPPDLIKPLIKSSCPQWVCKKCGKARERIVKVDRPDDYDPSAKCEYADKVSPNWHNRPLTKIFSDTLKTSRETIGWTDCGCNAGFKGGTILDPFTGKGTVLELCRTMDRSGIGFDIQKNYEPLIRKSIRADEKGIENWDED